MKQTIVTGYEYELTLITGEKKDIECQYSPEQLYIKKGTFSGTYTLVGGSKVLQEGCFDFKLQRKIEEEQEISPKEQKEAYILYYIEVFCYVVFVIGVSLGIINAFGYIYLGISLIVVTFIIFIISIRQLIRNIRNIKHSIIENYKTNPYTYNRIVVASTHACNYLYGCVSFPMGM